MSEDQTSQKNLKAIIITALIIFPVGFLSGVGFSTFKFHNKGKVPQQNFNHGSIQKSTQKNEIPNHYQNQIMKLEKKVLNNPQNREAWTLLGNLYFDQGEVIKSITSYKKSLELDPNNANVWTDIGVMYRRNNEPKKAIESFDKAYKINPQHEVALLNKGIILLYDLNDTVQAIEEWNKLTTLNNNARNSNGQLISEILTSLKK
ncbi:MAG: tetratricopeptide repeat protein [archaeon]|nr:tetratricopeptide repeat protein [archaeon]